MVRLTVPRSSGRVTGAAGAGSAGTQMPRGSAPASCVRNCCGLCRAVVRGCGCRWPPVVGACCSGRACSGCVCSGCSGRGDEGGGGLSGQQVQEGPGAQDVQGAGAARRLSWPGPARSGACPRPARRPTADRGRPGGGAGGLREHLHPTVLQRLLFAAPGGLRVRGEDRPTDQRSQLPAGQSWRPADDQLLDRRGVLIVQLLPLPRRSLRPAARQSDRPPKRRGSAAGDPGRGRGRAAGRRCAGSR